MKFYRTLQPFKVISFDLDDTLYDNNDVIRLAERQCVDFLHRLSAIEELDLAYWYHWKQKIERQDPVFCEDVTAWRIATIRAMLQFHGKTADEIAHIAQETINYFLEWRHKIDVPQPSIDVLNHLKTNYKLAALTNGNVVPQRIGLQQFDLLLCGGKQGRAKPHQDLFHQTAAYFKVRPQEILHVGDNLVTDVQGALQAGCQAVWINLSGKNLNHFPEATLLPQLEINDLLELLELV